MKSKYLIMLLLIVGYLTTINDQYEIKAAETAEQLTSADDAPKYLPMYENGRKWAWRIYKKDDPETTVALFEEVVTGDTLLNDIYCKKISNTLFGDYYAYEEGGIAYAKIYNVFMSLYRFDVQERDSLFYFYEDDFERKNPFVFTDFKIDSICVNNVVRKRIVFSWDDDGKAQCCWVEGIGSFEAHPMLVVYPSGPTKIKELIGCYDGVERIFTHADASSPSITDKSIHGVRRKLSRGQSNVATSDTNIVKLSYDDKCLSVELMSWERRDYVYSMWPRAYVDNDVIRIVPDIVNYDDAKILMHHNPDYIDVVRYYDVSFSFPGIEPGRYTVMLMSDDGKEVQSTYELDLTDGFSKQFPDDPSYDGAIEISNDVDITFDGTLVEFGSDGNATLALFTTEGVRLARAEGSGTVRLSTGELMPGIYVVCATTADGRTARRKIAVK